ISRHTSYHPLDFYCLLRVYVMFFFFFSSRRRHTRFKCDWSSDVCSSDLSQESVETEGERPARSDTSLERIAELPAGAQLPDGKRSEERRVGKECRSRGSREH